LGRAVIDMTGVAGAFDFTVEFPPDDGRSTDDPGAGASLFTALQEKLGLKLESRKGPVEILVIDRVEKAPKEN